MTTRARRYIVIFIVMMLALSSAMLYQLVRPKSTQSDACTRAQTEHQNNPSADFTINDALCQGGH